MTVRAHDLHLLHLLASFGGDLGAVDFQKLLFLYVQDVEPPDAPSYEFVPYKFGGFSFTSYAAKRKLIERGLLENDDRWQLTALGRDELAHAGSLPRAIAKFAERFATMRGDDLVRVAYREHPYYAIRSEIADHVLAGDARALAAIAQADPGRGLPGLCSIGYEGRSLEGYLNELLRDGVTLLCDVRRNPISRKYGFSRSTLAKGCEGVGIRYVHVPELGIASDERKELNSQADYDKLFAKYEAEDLPKQAESIATIRRWIATGERVALTCFERSPQQCHRHCVADAVGIGGGIGGKVRHL